MASGGDDTTPPDGLTIQRGGEQLRLEKSSNRFVVKKRSGTRRGYLGLAQINSGSFAELSFEPSDSSGQVEVYTIRANSRDDAMVMLRERGHDIHWCAHVYHMPGDPEGLLVPTDEIYAEFDTHANLDAINLLLDQHGLELIAIEDGPSNAFILRLTSASTKNPIKIANDLARSPSVMLAETDFAVRANLAAYRPTDTLFGQQWHLENKDGFGMVAGADVSAPHAWGIIRGDRAIVVAVIDDGVQIDHPEFDFADKIVAPVDFGQNDLDPSPATAEDKHGTACAGVAVAEENGEGVVGIAPGCGLMPIRWSVFITDQSIKNWFDHARVNGASAISCSWIAGPGFFPLSTSIRNTISKAAREGRDGRGCVVLFAAGNDDRPINGRKDGIPYKQGFAIHPDVIAVSASNSRDLRSDYSNYGDEIWVSALSSGAGGRPVVTADRTGTAGYSSKDYTYGFGGTSSATPLVAGICALMLSINPDLTSTEVKQILRDTAEKIDQANGNYNVGGHSQWYGWGRVNAFEAVKEAQRRLPVQGPEPKPHWLSRLLRWLVRIFVRR